MNAILGPHQGIASNDPREQFTADLLDQLWDVYRRRVAYVQTYEQVVRNHGATFVNDHIAFRTFAAQEPLTGIVFPDEATRPCLRYFRELQRKRLVPFKKIGRLTFFDPVEVRRALDRQFTVHPR